MRMLQKTLIAPLFLGLACISANAFAACSDAPRPGVDWSYCRVPINLVNADLTGAKLVGASFRDVNATGAKFGGADFTDAITVGMIVGKDMYGKDMKCSLDSPRGRCWVGHDVWIKAWVPGWHSSYAQVRDMHERVRNHHDYHNLKFAVTGQAHRIYLHSGDQVHLKSYWWGIPGIEDGIEFMVGSMFYSDRLGSVTFESFKHLQSVEFEGEVIMEEGIHRMIDLRLTGGRGLIRNCYNGGRRGRSSEVCPHYQG